MADERGFADVESMRPVVRAVFGSSRSPLRVERLAHGSKKGAYRLTMDEGGTALVYVWDGSEDYWQGCCPREPTIRPAPSRMRLDSPCSKPQPAASHLPVSAVPSFCSRTSPGRYIRRTLP
jgi:hypothetical protein